MVVYFLTFPPTPPPAPAPAVNAVTQSGGRDALTTTSAAASRKPVAELKVDHQLKQLADWRSERKFFETKDLKVEMNGLGEVTGVGFLKYPQEPKAKEVVGREFAAAKNLNRSTLRVGAEEVVWTKQEWGSNELRLFAQREGVEIQRRVWLEEGDYFLRISDTVQNNSAQSLEAAVELSLGESIDPKKQSGFWMRLFKPQTDFQKSAWVKKDSLDYQMFDQSGRLEVEEAAALSWSGFADKYFLYAAFPKNMSFESLEAVREGNTVQQKMKWSSKQSPPGERLSLDYAIYMGPKKISDLEKLSPSLSLSIEYGNWVGPIARFLLSVLMFFQGLVSNFGVAIFLLTLIVKVVLFPLSYKAAVSMRKLSLIQPKMIEIREKYKKDPHRMNSEMMSLYKTEKVNPVGGCLPMLLQMPIFFALYRVFFASIEMRHAPFVGWINDLSHYDPFFVLPVSMTILMVLQQKLTPMPETGQDSEAVRIQKAMFKWMPWFFGAIMLFLPAGLSFYMFVNAGISIAQQLFINKRMDKLYPRNTAPKLQVVNGG